MAFDAKDIERLRAAVPPTFQPPRDAAGLLSEHFFSVDLLRKSTALQGSENPARARERELYNLGLAALSGAEEGRGPAFLLPGPLAAIRNARAERRKQDEDRGAERRAFNQLLADIDARLAAIRAEMDAIDKRLAEIRERRNQIGEAMNAADDILEIRRRGGKLDASNPAHRKMLAALGITEAEANGDDYVAIIARRRADLDREDDGLAMEWDAKLRRRDELAIDYAGAVAARNEIENADTGEARILAARRATTVLGTQQLGTAAYLTESKGAKVVAAEAVADSEPERTKPGSEEITRDATISKASTLRSDVTSFTP